MLSSITMLMLLTPQTGKIAIVMLFGGKPL
jgi:hypothetical protein